MYFLKIETSDLYLFVCSINVSKWVRESVKALQASALYRIVRIIWTNLTDFLTGHLPTGDCNAGLQEIVLHRYFEYQEVVEL